MSGERLGSVLGSPGGVWGVLGRPWDPLSASWARLGPSWGRLGASWGHLGGVLGPLGGDLGPSWGDLEASWGSHGASWGAPGPSWGSFLRVLVRCRSRSRFGTHFRTILEPFWSPSWRAKTTKTIGGLLKIKVFGFSSPTSFRERVGSDFEPFSTPKSLQNRTPGDILGRPGASWTVLEASWSLLGASWGRLGASWRLLGASWSVRRSS